LRKILIALVIFLFLIVGLLYFSTTNYFFNKFVAPIVKEYNFNYKSVKGSLSRGFMVKNLTYKKNDLASVVVLRFNPFKLFLKRITINKLKLNNVNKETLKLIIDDFKQNTISSNSTNSNINLNFELKNIYLTFKPFKLQNLIVKENILKIKEFSCINGNINLTNNHYFYNTNLGELEFDGRYKNKILSIDKINLKHLDIQEVVKFIKSFDLNSSKSDNKETNILFMPKQVAISKLHGSLKPFKYKNLNIKNAKISGQNLKIDINNKKLQEAFIDLSLKTDISDFDTKLILKNKNLVVTDFELAILNTNSLVKFINNFSSIKEEQENSSTGSFELLNHVPLQNATINNISLLVKKFNYKDNKIKNITLNAKELNYDFNRSKLSLNNINLNVKSSLADILLNGSIKDNINIEKLSFKSNNLEHMLSLIGSLDSNNSSNNNTFNLASIFPKDLVLKNANIEFKKLHFLPYQIKSGLIKAKKLLIDLNNTIVKSGYLSVKNNSNWGKAELIGNIKNNNFYAKGFAKVNDTLTKEFSLPLNARNIEPVSVQGRFGLKSFDLNASLKGNNILSTMNGIDILSSNNKVYYNYITNKVYWGIDGNIKSNFLPLAKFTNKLQYENEKLTYYGKLNPKELPKISNKFAKYLMGLTLKYQGDSTSIDIKAISNYLKAKLYAKEYKEGILEIQNIKNIDLSNELSLKDAKISKLLIKAPIKFEKFLPLNGEIVLNSTLIDTKGEWKFDKNFILNSTVLNSKILPKEVNKKTLFPAKLNLEYKDNLVLNLKNNLFESNLKYIFENNKIDATLKSNTLITRVNGNTNNISLKIESNSVAKSLKEINSVYKLNSISNIQGALNIEIDTNFKDINYLLYSKELNIVNKKDKTVIKNINFEGILKNNILKISRYRLNINGFNFFANKESVVTFKNNSINLNSLYVNDSAFINGIYNIKNENGKLKLKANSFKFTNLDYDINTNLSLNINVRKNHYLVSGIVDIIKAKIKKNLENRNAAQSDDIIILQREAKKKSTFFVKNISLNLNIKSQKGIVYAQNGSYFIAYPKLKIDKKFNNFTKILGDVILDKKSNYKFKGKVFYIKRGKISFKGKNSVAYLNIVMYYKGREYNININISGNSNRPIIFFSSNPPLTKEQILAYLLFNDTAAAGSHSQESMMNLVGGVLAKSFFSSIGLKIDKLSIKENGFSIGKAINDKVIIYYNQEGETPSVKTRIDITKSIHSIIEVGEEKQSADIIFSKEY